MLTSASSLYFIVLNLSCFSTLLVFDGSITTCGDFFFSLSCFLSFTNLVLVDYFNCFCSFVVPLVFVFLYLFYSFILLLLNRLFRLFYFGRLWFWFLLAFFVYCVFSLLYLMSFTLTSSSFDSYVLDLQFIGHEWIYGAWFSYLYFFIYIYIFTFFSLALVFRFHVSFFFFFFLFGFISLVWFWVSDFFILFICLEILNFCFYGIFSSTSRLASDIEGLVKYFIFSSISSLLYFTTYLFFCCFVPVHTFSSVLSFFFMYEFSNFFIVFCYFFLCIFISFFIKAGLFPFSYWIIDFYQSSTWQALCIFWVFFKILFTFLFLKLFIFFLSFIQIFSLFFYFIGIGSIIFGSFAAFYSSSLKRIFAYSSLIHFGYILITLCFISVSWFTGFYVFSYCAILVPLLLFFSLISPDGRYSNLVVLTHLNVLARTSWVFYLYIFTLVASLAGLPPTFGSILKFFFFFILAQHNFLYSLVFLLIFSVLSYFLYFRLLSALYFDSFSFVFYLSWSAINLNLLIPEVSFITTINLLFIPGDPFFRVIFFNFITFFHLYFFWFFLIMVFEAFSWFSSFFFGFF